MDTAYASEKLRSVEKHGVSYAFLLAQLGKGTSCGVGDGTVARYSVGNAKKPIGIARFSFGPLLQACTNILMCMLYMKFNTECVGRTSEPSSGNQKGEACVLVLRGMNSPA